MRSVIAETIALIKDKTPSPLQDLEIEDLVIGVFFTGVKLSNGHAGVAFTPIGEMPEAVCCPASAARMPRAGNLEGKTVPDIINYALDPNVLKSAIGVATLNALSQWLIESENGAECSIIMDTDGFDLLEIGPDDTVSLIGAFGPYIRRLKIMGNPFFIIEKNPQTLRLDEMKYFRPASDMASTLGKSDAVIMTGTAIVNHTIDSILSLIGENVRAAIIGPTASMIPDAFFKRRARVMAGIRISNADLMLKILKQGGSAYHLLKGCAQKTAFLKKG